MTVTECQRTMQAYRLSRLVEDQMIDKNVHPHPSKGMWTSNDAKILAEAQKQIHLLDDDATAIAKRIVGELGGYTMKDLVEWYYLVDCPWDYVFKNISWEDVERAMLEAIAAVDY